MGVAIGDSVSPTSSPVERFKSLHADDSPKKLRTSHSQSSLDSRSSHRQSSSPFGTLAIPNGKANGSSHLLGDVGRRGSTNSVASAASSTSTYRIRRKPVPSDADENERRSELALSPQPSPAQETAPLPVAKDKAPIPPVKSDRRPSTGGAVPAASENSGLGLGIAQQPQASASARNLSTANGAGAGALAGPVASRTPSRATIKRPTTAPVGANGQFRNVSDAQKSVMEVEGQQFLMGKEEIKPKPAQDASPSIPNAVRFLQHQRGDSNGGDTASLGHRDSLLDARRKSASTNDTHHSDVALGRSPSMKKVGTNLSSGGWGIDEELQIVDRVRDANEGKAPKERPMSVDKSKKAMDAAAVQANLKNNFLSNIINEDESDEVKAAAREAGIPEGSYAIHPPSMLQLFEASQCIVYGQSGEEVMFGDLFKKRRTLVCFLRHWWCGFCQQFAMSVRHIDPLPLKKANLDFIIVGQGDWHVIKAYREVMQVQYPMYADPKRNVYRALGMTLRTNEANPACARPDYNQMSLTKGILVAIKKGLFDMPIRNPGDMKLLGGDFILGPGLQCSFTHRMTTTDGHMDLPRILAQAGCDMSLKTPKPLFTVEEKEARAAMLAGGNQNRRQTRSMVDRAARSPRSRMRACLTAASALSMVQRPQASMPGQLELAQQQVELVGPLPWSIQQVAGVASQLGLDA